MARRGYLCAVTLMGSLATVCLIFSVVMPQWIVMDRPMNTTATDGSSMQAVMNIFMTQKLRQALDEILDERMPENVDDSDDLEQDDGQDGRPSDWMPGDMDSEVRYPDWESVPVESDDADHHHPHPHHPHHHPHHHNPHHHHSHHHHHHGSSDSDESLGDDPTDMDELIWGRPDDHCQRKMADWAVNSYGMAQKSDGLSEGMVHIQAHYGLWFSRYCVTGYAEDGFNFLCVIVETGCALKYPWPIVFESEIAMMDGINVERLSHKHMGGASLLEHRIESTMGVVLCLIGVVAGVIGFRKTNGCCCMKSVCVVAMLITNILFLVPSIRLARYSQHKHAEHSFVDVQFAVSVAVAFTGCLLALITLVVAIVGLVKMHRKKSVGKWYQLNNELAADVTDEVKKPDLVTLTAEENEQPAKEAVA